MDIHHSMSLVWHEVLYLNRYDTLLQNATDITAKCDKSLLQNAAVFFTKCDSFITNCGDYISKCVRFVITKCDVFYKLQQ